MPFRNGTSLVAFRYDQAAQAEPPIPIRSAKSTLRCQPAAAAAAAAAGAATAGAKVTITLDVQQTPCILALASATTATDTATSSSSNPAVPILARTRLFSVPVSDPTTKATPKATCITPIPAVVALPHPPASGLLSVLPGTEEHLHPALRSDQCSSDADAFRKKQDYGHAPTTTSIFTSTSSLSQARTFDSESSGKEVEKEDQDPFPHEKIQSARRFKFVTASVIPPLQIRSSSPTPLYAQTHHKLGRGDDLNLEGANNNSISSIPLRSPGLSEARTGTSASPTTTPSYFPVEKISASSTAFSRRCFCFRTFKKKKQQQQPLLESPTQARAEDPSTTNQTPSLDGAKASSTPPVTGVAPPRDGDEQNSRVHQQDYYHRKARKQRP